MSLLNHYHNVSNKTSCANLLNNSIRIHLHLDGKEKNTAFMQMDSQSPFTSSNRSPSPWQHRCRTTDVLVSRRQIAKGERSEHLWSRHRRAAWVIDSGGGLPKKTINMGSVIRFFRLMRRYRWFYRIKLGSFKDILALQLEQDSLWSKEHRTHGEAWWWQHRAAYEAASLLLGLGLWFWHKNLQESS